MEVTVKSYENTVLVVDDSAISVHTISKCISGLANILVAKDGESALSIATNVIPDLILLDIEMPRISGLEVCKRLKQNPRTAGIAIIFITAHDHSANEIHAFGLGGIDFISKPINLATFGVRISTQLKLIQSTKLLIDARNELSHLIQTLPVFVSHWSTSCENTFSNDFSGEWFKCPSNIMRGKPLSNVLPVKQMEFVQPLITKALNGESNVVEMLFTSTDNKQKFVQLSLISDQIYGGINGFLLIITDITERKQGELKLKENDTTFSLTLDTIGDGVIATDEKGNITFMNLIAEGYTGFANAQAIGKPIETVVTLYDSATKAIRPNPVRECLALSAIVKIPFDTTIVDKKGSSREIENSSTPILNDQGDLIGAIFIFHDVTEAKATEAKMAYLANYDPLTNLPNRVLLLDRLEQAIHKADRDKTTCAVLLLDIDNFVSVNHTNGYLVGDLLLKSVTAFLKVFLRQSDTLARIGGDEFAILLNNADSAEQVDEFCRRLLSEFQRDWNVHGNQFNLTVSIGVSLFPTDGADAHTIYRRGESALQETKRLGKNNYRFFSSEIERQINAQHLSAVALRKAIVSGEIEVFYQPKYDGNSNKVFGFEALSRWIKEDGSVVLPDIFIPLAEQSKLIIPLGLHVLETACRQAVIWQKNMPNLTMAVNISSVQVNPSLVDTVRTILQSTGMPAHLLELEITESILLNDDHSITTFGALKALGCKVCMDDFGTGYSSLSYIKNYPLDVLKIDQSFVQNMLENEVDMSIIGTIINLAKNLKLSLVAEGVETKDHADALLAMGCDQFQGYYFSKAQTAKYASKQLINHSDISH
jgi:diguanylate cyclase (GGDEF)-like protein/PAS domain S-box-containing protein